MEQEYYRPTREERKEVTLGIRAPVGIRNGKQCTNYGQDQQHIIFLLNKIPSSAGGTLYPTGPTNFKAPRDGYCDPGLSNLISNFQRQNGLKADGVVDPNGPTLKALNKLPTGGVPLKPVSHHGVSPQQIEALNELLDICAGFAGNPGLPAQFRSEVGGAAGEIESEMARLGIPNRQRRPRQPDLAGLQPLLSGLPPGVRLPVANNVTVREMGAGMGIIEVLAAAFAGLVLIGGLLLLLRKLLKPLRLYLLLLAKTAVDVLTEIKMVVARAEASTNRNRCRAEDVANFYQATSNFRNALEAQTTSKSVLGPVVRAWWNSLKRLFFCMEESTMWTILKLLGTNLAGSLILWEFILYYLQ